uniref:Uncharacterized protein n=1 Tax=Rhizophora mucronata TaxID=61149 RepID=A0A2P2J3L6_RHIMU
MSLEAIQHRNPNLVEEKRVQRDPMGSEDNGWPWQLRILVKLGDCFCSHLRAQ